MSDTSICSKLAIKTSDDVTDVVLLFLIVNFEHMSHFFFNVSIVDFKQVNIRWVIYVFIPSYYIITILLDY